MLPSILFNISPMNFLLFQWGLEHNNFSKYNLFWANSNSGMLSIADLNIIIKYYAIRIQQRIEELQHFSVFPNDPPDQQDCDFISLITKYTYYSTSDEKEMRLARKFAQRVMQIFEFFKGKSSSQNLLGVIQARIERELQELVAPVPIKLGELFSYIHLLTRRGCVVRPPAEKKRIISRPIFKEVKGEERAPTFSFFNLQKRVTSALPSNKHIRTNTNPPLTPPIGEKWKADQVIALLSGMDLDRGHLARVREGSEPVLFREALRRNEKFIQQYRRQDKRKNRRTMTQMCEENPILGEVKTNALKGGWSKKRRAGLLSRKKHNSIKENISIFV